MSTAEWLIAYTGAGIGSLQVLGSSRKLGEGWVKVYSCYEAGACGYWYHRELVKRGAINLLVPPQPLETRRKGQKTDLLGARALLVH